MPSCGFIAQVVSAVVAAFVAVYLGPQTSLAVFDPWRADGPLDFKTPYWRPHTPVSTPGIHLPFPPNDTAPFPSIPYATPHFLLPDVEKLVALAYLNGSNSAASAAAASASSAAATASNQRLAAPGSWLPPSVSAVLTTVLKLYGQIACYTLTVVAHLLAANVLWCCYLTKQSVAPVFVYKPPHRPTLPSVATIKTSARGTQTDLTDLLINGSTSAPVWPRMDNGTQTSAPVLAVSELSSIEILPSSPPPVSTPARPTSDSATQTSSPPASTPARLTSDSGMQTSPAAPTPARPTSETGTQFSPPASPHAPKLALSGISSIEILPSAPSPASTPARPTSDSGMQTSPAAPTPARPTSEAGTQYSPPASPHAPILASSEISAIELLRSSFLPASTPAFPSSDAGSQTSPRPPPTRPSFNPGANNFVPNSCPGAFIPPAGGRGGPGNFARGGGAPPFGARGGGGFVPPFGGRGGFVPQFAPQFPGGAPKFPGGAPQFPGGAPQFPPGGPPKFPGGGPHQFPSGAPNFPGGPPQFPGGAPPFAGRGGFPSRVPVPFAPANGSTFPSTRAKPGTPGGPPVATSAKVEWDAWNKRYPQHGKQVESLI